MNKDFKLGDKVWHASFDTVKKTAVCPECFGKKYLTVILGDDSKVTINCRGCASGFEQPKGYINYWEWQAKIEQVTIAGMDINQERDTEYRFHYSGGDNCYSYRTSKYTIFSTKEEAERKGKELAEEHNKQELQKIHRKGKHNSDWAWDVHYYRQQIRSAEKEIIQFTEKLNVAEENAKKQKEEVKSERNKEIQD